MKLSGLGPDSIFMYTVDMKYILDLLNNEPDFKYNLSEIDIKISCLLDKLKRDEGNEYSIFHFALLSRAKFYLSSLEKLNNYERCTDLHYELFFLLYFGLIDVLDKFHRNANPDIINCFHKSIEELRKTIEHKIINEKKLFKYISFIRAISFAHIASTNTAGGFLNMDVSNNYFVLTSIYPFKMSWPKGKSGGENEKAFYFHTILKIGDNCKAIIFPVYVEELERYIISLLNNTNLNSLK